VSLTPFAIQNAFRVIKKTWTPYVHQRGRAFEAAILRLVEWWAQEYFQIEMTGHIRSKTFEEVQKSLASGEYDFDEDGNLVYGEGDYEHEIVKSAKSLMKHVLMRRGSRDVSSQLFTALCRALEGGSWEQTASQSRKLQLHRHKLLVQVQSFSHYQFVQVDHLCFSNSGSSSRILDGSLLTCRWQMDSNKRTGCTSWRSKRIGPLETSPRDTPKSTLRRSRKCNTAAG
jgi:hypothetical protein